LQYAFIEFDKRDDAEQVCLTVSLWTVTLMKIVPCLYRLTSKCKTF
jgi:hypothetical protein